MRDNEPCESSNDAAPETYKLFEDAITSDQERSTSYHKNGKQTASNSKRVTRGKNDPRYWWARIFKPVSGRGEISPHYAVKIQFRGRRVAFTLSTGNKDAAARRASKLYADIVHRGLDAVVAERRAMFNESDEEATPILTIGNWIESAGKVFDGKPATLRGYAGALRLIASEILAVSKEDNQRFAQKHAETYRRKIDAFPLSILTPEAVQAWRISYVAKAGDPARQRAARISCNSTLRAARAIFGRKILKFTSASLPEPIPFTGVEFYPRESMRYHSKIDPAALLQAASQELAESDSDAFKALLLALGAGLRRGEIDRLLWKQVDFRTGLIHVEVTEASSLKSADSHGAVAIDVSLSSVLQGFRAKAKSDFVIEEGSSLVARRRRYGRSFAPGERYSDRRKAPKTAHSSKIF